MLDANVVGSVLQRLREERGLSQEIVSGLAGIGRTHLSAIERGERKPTLETFYRIGRGAAHAAECGAGGDRGGAGQGAGPHLTGNAAPQSERRKKTGEQLLSCFCFSFAPSGVTVPRGNTAGRGLRGADFRAWNARS